MNIVILLGYGVFTLVPRKKGCFLLEYGGKVIAAKDGEKREKNYEKGKKGCFIFYFDHGKDRLW